MYNYQNYKILQHREKIFFSKLSNKNLDKIKRFSEDDIKSLIRIFYIWGEPLWGGEEVETTAEEFNDQ